MVNTMVSVGSSMVSGSSGDGIGEIGDALADLNAFHAGDGHDVARDHLFGFFAIQAAKGKELGDLAWERSNRRAWRWRLRRHGFNVPLKHARDGDAAEEFAVIEVHNLNLQDARRIARRGRIGFDDVLEQRLELGGIVAYCEVRDAESWRWCRAPGNRAGLRWLQDR